MKKAIVSAFLGMAVIAGFIGCKKIIKAVFPGLDTEVSTTVNIPTIPYAPSSEIPLGSFTQHFNLDSVVNANTSGAFGASDVSTVTIRQIVFTMPTADDHNNLSNFESARFNLSSDTKTNPIEVASITFPDNGESTYTYTPPAPVELRPYLDGTELTYTVYGKIRRITSRSMPLNVRVSLHVK